MSQFRTTADLVDSILTRCGEVTNGNSSYDTGGDVLGFLNRVHFSLIAGGTIAIGKDSTVEIDETWPWAKAKRPLILELQPKYDSATVALTLGSEVGTLSAAPSYSLEGWYISITGFEGIYRIASNTAASTTFELDAAWPGTSTTVASCVIFKLDYDLTPDYLVIDSTNNKFEFRKVALGTVLTATLTAGSYTPAQLATHVATQATTAAGGPTITGSYSSVTKLFTFTSDGAAATVFQPMFASGTNQLISVHKLLGFDDSDLTGALTYSSTYILGGIARLIEPMKRLKGYGQEVYGIDSESFSRDYTFLDIDEGDPTRFTVIRENPDGSLRVRFNKYPTEKTRIEVEHVPVPRDLKDVAGSIPLVPRKFIDVLEDAGTFYIMLLKNDDRSSVYAQLAQGKLLAMISQHRGSLLRGAKNFGEIIPRRDQLGLRRRRLFPSEPYE